MKYPWLFVGAKVVCVDAVARGPGFPWVPLVEGATYEVAGIVECWHDSTKMNVCLKGQPNKNTSGKDRGYFADRFRPLIDTTKTVAALNQMMRDHVNHASGGLGIGKVRA